jgi:ABC-type sugar transport system ATPase subunit
MKIVDGGKCELVGDPNELINDIAGEFLCEFVDLPEMKNEQRCSACGCATPSEAEAKECGCDAPVCEIQQLTSGRLIQ